MKSYIINLTFILISFPGIIFCQKAIPLYREILPQTVNFNTDDSIKFSMEPISISYCNSVGTFYIDNNASSSSLVIKGNSYGYTDEYGFNVCYNYQGYPKFWLSFNRISIFYKENSQWEKKIEFYIDYRDSQYGSIGGNDITIRVFKQNFKTYIASSLQVGNPIDTSNFTRISNRNIFRISSINNYPIFNTSNLPDYWQNCLVVIPKKASDGVEVPYLVWGPIPNFLPTGYKIYCSINTQGGPPGNFGLLAQVDANTTEYMHEGLESVVDGRYIIK